MGQVEFFESQHLTVLALNRLCKNYLTTQRRNTLPSMPAIAPIKNLFIIIVPFLPGALSLVSRLITEQNIQFLTIYHPFPPVWHPQNRWNIISKCLVLTWMTMANLKIIVYKAKITKYSFATHLPPVPTYFTHCKLLK